LKAAPPERLSSFLLLAPFHFEANWLQKLLLVVSQDQSGGKPDRDPRFRAQVRHLLEPPKGETLKARRDRAIISILFHHALRRDELCELMVKDIHERRGAEPLRVHSEGAKVRHVRLHLGSQEKIDEHLQAAGHGGISSAPVVTPFGNYRRGTTDAVLTTNAVCQLIRIHGKQIGVSVDRFGPHSARTTAATKLLNAGADIAKAQERLSYANLSSTRIYDHRKTRTENSPTFGVENQVRRLQP
jgi:integrase/recombinase XerD